MMFNIHMLPASFGDCLLIEYGEANAPKYILIDGGPYYQFDEIYATLKDKLPDLKEIELLIITHIDIDHIDGVIRMLNHEPPLFRIKQVWFNDYQDLHAQPEDLLGGLQGSYLGILTKHKDLDKNEKPITIHRTTTEIQIPEDLDIKIVNPTQKALKDLVEKWDKHVEENDLDPENEAAIWNSFNGDKRYEPLPADLLGLEKDVREWAEADCKEDKSAANRSSIAFIISYKGMSCLMSGDVPSKDLRENLEALELLDEFGQLHIDAWKLSHHGSKKSTQDYVIKMIQTNKVLISSDGKRYHHPDKETIAKLLVHQEADLDIYFNYTSKYNMIWADPEIKDDFKATFHFPEEEGYSKVMLIE